MQSEVRLITVGTKVGSQKMTWKERPAVTDSTSAIIVVVVTVFTQIVCGSYSGIPSWNLHAKKHLHPNLTPQPADKLHPQEHAHLLTNPLWHRPELFLGSDTVSAPANSPAWIWGNWCKLRQVVKSHTDLLFHMYMLTADCSVQISSDSETWGPYHKLIPITGPLIHNSSCFLTAFSRSGARQYFCNMFRIALKTAVWSRSQAFADLTVTFKVPNC